MDARVESRRGRVGPVLALTLAAALGLGAGCRSGHGDGLAPDAGRTGAAVDGGPDAEARDAAPGRELGVGDAGDDADEDAGSLADAATPRDAMPDGDAATRDADADHDATATDGAPSDAGSGDVGPPDAGPACGPSDDGRRCDDGDLCTTDDACQGGVCRGGAPRVCPDATACRFAARCEPARGCVANPRPDGARCEDGDLCTIEDRCLAGACVGGPAIDCPAPGPCERAGRCDPAVGACVLVPRADGEACDDGDLCTEGDVCRGGTCAGAAPPAPVCTGPICLEDVTVAAGLARTSSAGPLVMGAGVAWVDLDVDGWPDLVEVSESSGVRVLRNELGRFVDATAGLALSWAPGEVPMGVAVGDVDADGDPDLYVYARGANHLLLNEGGFRLVDGTAAAGVDDARWTTAAAFGDLDGDGDLDLYVGNYIARASFPFHTPAPNALFVNRGDGRFDERATPAGVAGAGTTLVVRIDDVDLDGDLDLWVCNDFGATVEPNRLYLNRGHGPLETRLVESSTTVGAALELFCMGVASGDVDGDGDLDAYFTSLGPNALLVRTSTGGYVDRTAAWGATLGQDRCRPQERLTSWTARFVDLDLDGRLDLFVANGHVPADPSLRNSLRAHDSVLHNQGARFEDVSLASGVGGPGVGRGAAVADFDRDGDPDLVVAEHGVGLRLLRNAADPRRGLVIEAVARRGHPDALGLIVELETGGRRSVHTRSRSGAYQSSDDPAIFAGQAGGGRHERLTARWPSGTVQRLHDLEPPARLRLVEPSVGVVSATIAAGSTPATPRLRIPLDADGHRELELLVLSDVVGAAPVPRLRRRVQASGLTELELDVPGGLGGPWPRVVVRAEDDDGGVDEWSGRLGPL